MIGDQVGRVVAWSVGLLPSEAMRKISSLRYQFPVLGPLFVRAGNLVRGHDLTIQAGPGKGLRFNCGRALAGFVVGYMEPHIASALVAHLRPGMVAYDLGANVGFHSVVMARLVGPTGQVVSVEPSPENASFVRHNAALNSFGHVKVIEAAIGECDRTADLRLDATPGCHRIMDEELAAPVGTVPVAVRSLDSIVASEPGIRPPAFIKMDIEGAEVLAVQGARDVLTRHRPVMLIELHKTNREIMPALKAVGYDARVLIDPGAKSQAGASSVEDADWNVHILAVPRS